MIFRLSLSFHGGSVRVGRGNIYIFPGTHDIQVLNMQIFGSIQVLNRQIIDSYYTHSLTPQLSRCFSLSLSHYIKLYFLYKPLRALIMPCTVITHNKDRFVIGKYQVDNWQLLGDFFRSYLTLCLSRSYSIQLYFLQYLERVYYAMRCYYTQSGQVGLRDR